jgi:hypothetical protein
MPCLQYAQLPATPQSHARRGDAGTDLVTTVAVMQPYFIPYAGYFRLFAAADVFVAFDCVQFPRRGWVHRNRFPTARGIDDWLTLPLRKCARDTRIADLHFLPDADAVLEGNMHRFPILNDASRQASPFLGLLTPTGTGSVTDYLCAQLEATLALLNISCPIVRSTSLSIPPDLHGQARVIAIARELGATRYINSPGGRSLYQQEAFAEHRIALKFLTPYTVSNDNILTLLLTRPAASIAEELRRETVLAD